MSATSSQLINVTSWKTPEMSSTVEWSVSLFVPVVEAVQLCGDYPGRQRSNEHRVLPRVTEPVRVRSAHAEDERRHDKRNR